MILSTFVKVEILSRQVFCPWLCFVRVDVLSVYRTSVLKLAPKNFNQHFYNIKSKIVGEFHTLYGTSKSQWPGPSIYICSIIPCTYLPSSRFYNSKGQLSSKNSLYNYYWFKDIRPYIRIEIESSFFKNMCTKFV